MIVKLHKDVDNIVNVKWIDNVKEVHFHRNGDEHILIVVTDEEKSYRLGKGGEDVSHAEMLNNEGKLLEVFA